MLLLLSRPKHFPFAGMLKNVEKPGGTVAAAIQAQGFAIYWG